MSAEENFERNIWLYLFVQKVEKIRANPILKKLEQKTQISINYQDASIAPRQQYSGEMQQKYREESLRRLMPKIAASEITVSEKGLDKDEELVEFDTWDFNTIQKHALDIISRTYPEGLGFIRGKNRSQLVPEFINIVKEYPLTEKTNTTTILLARELNRLLGFSFRAGDMPIAPAGMVRQVIFKNGVYHREDTRSTENTLKVSAEVFEEYLWDSFVLTFRQFLMEDENLNFEKICERSISCCRKGDRVKKQILEAKRQWKSVLDSVTPSFSFKGGDVGSTYKDLLNLWFYGGKFYTERDKVMQWSLYQTSPMECFIQSKIPCLVNCLIVLADICHNLCDGLTIVYSPFNCSQEE